MRAIILILLALSSQSYAKERESHYQQIWCDEKAGETEVVLPDRTRVDRMTYYHAIEFDFTAKWAEAIGQALHYAQVTGMRGGIVLIGDDRRFIDRARNIIEHYNLPLDLWAMPE